MAYISRIYKTSDYTYDQQYDLVCQFLVDIGWILHDSFDNTKVYKNASSTVNRPYVYLALTHTAGSNYAVYDLYLYWNAATHTGTLKALIYTSESYHKLQLFSSSTYYLTMYGNKDYFCIHPGNYYNANIYYAVAFCYFTDLWDDTKTVLNSSANQGYNVTIHVADTSGFIVGRLYQIVGANGEGRDSARQVLQIIDSTHMVIDDIPRNYSAGSYIGVSPCPAGITSAGTSGVTYHQFFTVCGKLRVGLEAPTTNDYIAFAPFGDLAFADPSGAYQRHILVPIAVYENDTYPGYLGLLDNDYFRAAVGTLFDTFGVKSGQTISGTVTASGANTLTDSTKTWTVNEHSSAGRYVIITENTGVYQIRKIASNTATQLTLTTAWHINPDTTSKYQIVDEAWRSVSGSVYNNKLVCREIIT